MDNNLQLVKQDVFGNVICDFYEDNNNDLWMTRNQIGQALEYSDPQKAIDNIHSRHKKRLDAFSVTLTLGATDGKSYETTVYSHKGVYEICRWSQKPKADAFMDWVWNMIESIRKGELHISSDNVTISPVIINTKIEALILHSQQQEKFIKQLMNQLAFMTSQVMKQSPPVHRSERKRSLRERLEFLSKKLDKPQSKILSGIYKKMQTENGIILEGLQNAIYNETGRNPNAIDTIDYYENLHSIFEEWLDCLVSNVKEKSQLCEIV